MGKFKALSLKSISTDRVINIPYSSEDEEELFKKLESIGIKVDRRSYGW